MQSPALSHRQQPLLSEADSLSGRAAILFTVPLPQFQPMPLGRARDPFSHPEFESTAKAAASTPAPMICLMPHQSPFCLFHLVFEASCLFFVLSVRSSPLSESTG